MAFMLANFFEIALVKTVFLILLFTVVVFFFSVIDVYIKVLMATYLDI